MRGVGGVRKSIDQSWFAKELGLGLLCWGFKGFQKEIPCQDAGHSSNRVSGISTRIMHQFITPSISQTIWPRRASRLSLSLSVALILLPVTFAYSLSSQAVVMRQLRRWKRLWRRSLTRSHKRTPVGRSRNCWNGITSALQPEEITSKGTRVSCVYYQKKSGKLFNAPRIYIYIYIYISLNYKLKFNAIRSVHYTSFYCNILVNDATVSHSKSLDISVIVLGDKHLLNIPFKITLNV